MKRWTLVLLPVLVLGSLIGWRFVQKRADNLAQANMREMRKKAPQLVSTAAVTMRDIVHTFDATGTVESPQNVKIAAKVTGRVDYLVLREGDRVKKGQVLVRIDPRQVEAEVHQQMASLAEAQFRLAQAQMTQNSTNVGVNAQVRQQKAAVTSAQADLHQVQQNYAAQQAAANAVVTDAQARIANAKAAIRSAQANLDNARGKSNRITDLYKQGFVAAQDVDDAKAEVSVQQSALEIAQGLLNSAAAQHDAAQQQASIVKTKGTADIAASQAKVEQARASLEYANASTSQKSAYQQSLSALRSSVDAAKAALRSAEAQRSDTVLVSPLDGFVTGRYVDPGAMASAGQPILAVQFVKQVWVTISVPEEISTLVHIGQPATVTLDALPGQRFAGSVVQFNPSADLQSRQFMVRVILSNDRNLFKPGMFAHVSLETERAKNAVSVPHEAVQEDKSGAYVVVVELGKQGGKAQRRSVITGVSDDSFTAIDQGVKPGEKVVTLSAFPVRDGMSVRAGGGRRGVGAKHSQEGVSR
jgi:RND family efflux transporter MFP subunit